MRSGFEVGSMAIVDDYNRFIGTQNGWVEVLQVTDLMKLQAACQQLDKKLPGGNPGDLLRTSRFISTNPGSSWQHHRLTGPEISGWLWAGQQAYN